MPFLAFAALCYLPLLATRPGWISADTKSYLYLDPGRLLSRAWSMWDPQIGLGTVSHQTIGYLWPMGPWYWVFERLGVPDWVAQRLWWGTLLFMAGLGVVYLLRRLGWEWLAIWPAAVVYAMSPYLLTHIGRLSGVLLPFVGLPWMIGLTIMAIRSGRWRHPALFALVVTTVGSVNLTALALAGLGPLIWIAYVVITGLEPVGRVLRAVARIAVLTTVTSLWWLSGLMVQASHGIDIVRYTETAEVVARTSTAFEVLRGLGYWFFYGGDKLQLWLEISYVYTQRPWLIAATFALPVLAFLAPAIGRWRHQAFAITLVVVGGLLSIGAYPWDDSTPFGSFLQWFLATERGLAFRSLSRSVPLVALGSALLIGGAVASLCTRWPRQTRAGAGAVMVLAVVALAPLWQRSLVNDSLARQDIPAYWFEATEALDERSDGSRVLELPGTDFAAYRWGMTVDPVTPGLTDRPYVARELVPFGNPMGADLINSFDLRIQEHTIAPESIAPVARLLRAGDLVARNDLEFERHSTARPRLVWDLLGQTSGLDPPVEFGEPVPNEAGPILQHQDELWLLREGTLANPPPVAIFGVTDAPPIISLKPAESPVLLAGDGAGIVDAAAAGLIDGTELVRYTGELDDDEILTELANGATLIVTDTNRKRGERWGALRHNRGHTERIDESPLREDLADNRLPRFPDADSDSQTVTIQRGGITADATAYGNPITYAGEERAARAVDGDPRTAWSVGVFSDARGERLRVTLDEPLDLDWIRLSQLPVEDSNRYITQVRITLDGADSFDVDLDDSSRGATGQQITFTERPVSQVEVEVLADTAGDAPRFGTYGPVGISELVLGPDSPIIDEIIRVPIRPLVVADQHLVDSPLALVLTRIRQDPTDRTRDDEERSIRRLVEMPVGRNFSLEGVVRMSARADDDVLDRLLGHTSEDFTVTATDRMDGSRVERAAAAFDGDPETAWTTPWGQPVDHSLTIEVAQPRTFDGFDLELVTDGRHSVPTSLRISVDGSEVDVVDLPDLVDLEEPGGTTRVPVAFTATTGTELEIEFLTAREVRSIDWTEARPLAHPIGVAEVDIEGLSLGPVPDRLDSGCIDDVLTVAGEPISLRVSGATADALAGRPLQLDICGPDSISLPAGDQEIIVAPGVDTGLDIDALVLAGTGAAIPAPAPAGLPLGQVEVLDQGPASVRVRLTDLEPGAPVWFILGQSQSTGWQAEADGIDLGESRLVDGYANGWLVTPEADEMVIELSFAPQRTVNLALGASAIGVFVCLFLLVLDRRAPRRPAPEPSAMLAETTLTHRYQGAPPPTGVAVGAVVATFAVAAILATPATAAVLAVAVATGTRVAGARAAIALLPAALLGLAGLYVLAWQIRHSIEPGMEWVGELDRAHPLALAALLALPLGPCLDRLWRGRSERDTADATN